MTSLRSDLPDQPALVSTVLFDCDGVLQEIAGGRSARFEHLVGDEADELEDLIGQAQLPAQFDLRGFHDVVAGLVELKGWDVDPGDIVDVHVDIEVHDGGGHEVAAELRRAGVRVGIATNQHRRRAEHMRTDLGYEDLFDASFYSCDLGYAKPDPRFFSSIVEQLDQPAHEVAFIDDRLYHVESARSVGLRAVHWHHEEGIDRLRALLGELGLPIAQP